jgi:hypothetical protein
MAPTGPCRKQTSFKNRESSRSAVIKRSIPSLGPRVVGYTPTSPVKNESIAVFSRKNPRSLRKKDMQSRQDSPGSGCISSHTAFGDPAVATSDFSSSCKQNSSSHCSHQGNEAKRLGSHLKDGTTGLEFSTSDRDRKNVFHLACAQSRCHRGADYGLWSVGDRQLS